MRFKRSLIPMLCSQRLSPRQRWDQRYRQPGYTEHRPPSAFVRECLQHIPPAGWALDIAAGAGRHSLLLAEHGLKVVATDISWEGLQIVHRRARERGLEVFPVVADHSYPWLPQHMFDVILNTLYLERKLVPLINERLKTGGYLIFETFTVLQRELFPERGMCEAYLLRPGELRRMFAGYEVLAYEERVDEDGALARLFARKPA